MEFKRLGTQIDKTVLSNPGRNSRQYNIYPQHSASDILDTGYVSIKDNSAIYNFITCIC